jgi:AcrR family transcriptional regulator
MGRPGRETPDKADAYKRALAVLRRGGSLAEAAKAAGVGRDTLWEWRKKDADFAAQAEEAMGAGIDRLEDTLTLCAQKALTNPAYQKALIFLLTNRRPDKWKHFRHVTQPSEFKFSFVDLPATTGSIGIEARKRLLQNRLAELDRKGDKPDCSPKKR